MAVGDLVWVQNSLLFTENKEQPTYHFWPEGRVHLPLLQRRPVDCFEERMVSDIPSDPKSFCWIPFKELQEKTPSKVSELLQRYTAVEELQVWC